MVAIPAHTHDFTIPTATEQNIRDGTGGGVAVQPGELRTVLNEDIATLQPLDASLTAFAALTTAADKGIYFTGADTPATYDLTSFGRTVGGYASAAALRDGVDVPIYCADRAAVRALDKTKDIRVYFDGSVWERSNADLSSTLVSRTVTTVGGSAGSDTLTMRNAASTVKQATITMTIASPAVVTWTAHGLVAGDQVVFTTTGSLPTGVTAGTKYYVIAAGLATDTFQFSATSGGSAVNTSGTQSGTHTGGTNVFLATAHGYSADDEVYVGTSVDGFSLGAKMFVYNPTADTYQLRTSLTATAFQITGVTAFTIYAPHKILSGQVVVPQSTVNGLTSGTKYYAIRSDANTLKFATTYANAMAGTAIDLSAASAITLKVLVDPLEAAYIITTGDSYLGTAGAYVRQDAKIINATWCGAVGDDSTDNAEALQHASWLGYDLGRATYFPAGTYQTSRPIQHLTFDWLASSGDTKSPQNGITWIGDGGELSIIKCSSSFPNSTSLITLDGNLQAADAVVGSRSYAQGFNTLRDIGFRGRGEGTGTAVKGFTLRGCWGMLWHGVDMRDFVGDFVTVTTGGADEVDNTANAYFEKCRFHDGGDSCFVMRAVRVANVHIRDCEIRNFVTYGVHATLAYGSIKNTIFDNIGNRSVTTTGGIRLVDSATATESRTIEISGNVFEQCFNMDLAMFACRGGRIINNSFHTFLPTGGVVTGKTSLVLKNGGAGTCHNIVIEGNRWPDYSAPTDGSKYDVPNITIESQPTDIFIRGNVTDNVIETFFTAASADRIHLWCPITYQVAFTGTAPVDSSFNGRPIGTDTGRLYTYSAAPAAKTTSATLTAAEVLNGMITANQGGGAAATYTLPTCADLEDEIIVRNQEVFVGMTFEFVVVNISTNAAEDATIATNTGWTLVGEVTVESNDADRAASSGVFRARRTAADTFTLYRVS